MYVVIVFERDESVYIQARESVSGSEGTTNSMTANTRCGCLAGLLNDAISSESLEKYPMNSPW